MLFALLILVGLASNAVLYVIDITQSKQTIRKNYPVIGRLRYVFILACSFANTSLRWIVRSSLIAHRGLGCRAETSRQHPCLWIDQTSESAGRHFSQWRLSAYGRRDQRIRSEPLIFGEGTVPILYRPHSSTYCPLFRRCHLALTKPGSG